MKLIKSAYHLVRRVAGLTGKKSILGKDNKISFDKKKHHILFDINGNNNIVNIAASADIKNTIIYIRGNDHTISIGNNCRIGGGELWIEDNGGKLLIGDNTTIESAHLAVTEPGSKIEIYEDCMFAHDVEIRTGDSHAIIDIQTNERVNKAQNIVIKEHVWIGAHARILKGVTIDTGSIIGNSSLVTADVPSFSVVAGIPAKLIRQQVKWTRER